jgi:hypothetical protein
MEIKNKYLVVGGAALAIAAGGVGVAAATGGIGGDDGDSTLSGPAADQATAAALAITHGGTANSVERDSENGATYEVEVTKPDGSTVDVRLDGSYNQVAVEGDSGDQAEASDQAEQGGDQGEAPDPNEHGEDGD